MERPRNRRDIISRRDLTRGLFDLDAEVNSAARTGVLDLCRRAMETGQAEIRRRFEENSSGLEAASALAYMTDQVISSLFDFATQKRYPISNPTASERLCLVAVGGYGRGEMAPHSDVDLLFLHPYKATARNEQVIETMLYILWDLGLTVGQATRSVDECIARARKDITIRTNLLEARYVYGDQDLFVELKRRFDNDVMKNTGAEYLAAKLAERDERHSRMGDSRYVLEPNIKDGKGGMRDLHTLFWIAKYLYRADTVKDLVSQGVFTQSELNQFNRAHRFFWAVRFHLHYLSGRPEERLVFDMQPQIAAAMNYTDHAGTLGVERFMKHYYYFAKHVGDLTRIVCADLESKQKRRRSFRLANFSLGNRTVEGFSVRAGRLSTQDDTQFENQPGDMVRLFRVAQDQELDIHPHALRLITHNLKKINREVRQQPEVNKDFMEVLSAQNDPETGLRRMNEAGVLGQLITDFGRVVAQTQHDLYHVYTVDEHTIFAIGILSKIESGALSEDLPLATEVVKDVLSREVLYLAVFLHDIAKGRGGDHSELGAKVAMRLGPRMGLTDEQTETVSWLVKHHLLFSNTAFKRDISDPKTVADFVEIVQSPERLRLLLVLTVADIRAVGPNVWNGWKGQLLRDLYHEAEITMLGGRGGSRSERAKQAQSRLQEVLVDWPQSDFDTFVSRMQPSYWLSVDIALQERHARLLRRADNENAPLMIETRVDHFRSVTELILCAPDHHGLFAGIAGAISGCGAQIVDARIFTTGDGTGVDTFWIQDESGGAFERPDRLARLATTIEQTLSNDYKPSRLLEQRRGPPSRTSVFGVAPRVLVDNRASNTYTVIEVNGRDRPGLLYDIAKQMVSLRLSIGRARISTYGVRAVDVFYVKDLFGLKVDQDSRIETIKQTLTAAIADEDSDPAGQSAVSTAAE